LKESYLKNTPLFANVANEELQTISQHLKIENYQNGEIIFAKGSDSTALYIIKNGWVSLSPDGQTPIANLSPGNLLGEIDFLQGTPYSMTATATADVSLLVLYGNSLESIIRSQPQIGLNISVTFGKPITQMYPYLVDMLGKTSSFKAVSLDERRLIADRFQFKTYRANETIFRSGDTSAGLFLIEQGLVHLIGETDDDYNELNSGDVFGEVAMLSGKRHTATAQSAQQTIVWHLSTEDFNQLSKTNPKIRNTLSRTSTGRLSIADQLYAADILARVPIFDQLSRETLEHVASQLVLRHVPANQTIYYAGDAGDALHIVESGEVEIRNERGHTIGKKNDGDYFGENALLTGKSRTQTAIASTPTNVWAIYRADFDVLLVKHPELSMALSQTIKEKLETADTVSMDKHLQKLAKMGKLSRLELDELSSRLQPHSYQRGEIIYQEGDMGQALYFIENGHIERLTSSPYGTIPLPRLTAGDIFGEDSLSSGQPHTSTARAQTNVALWFLPKQDFHDLVSRYPNFSTVLNQIMSERLVETMDIMRGGQSRPYSPQSNVPRRMTGRTHPVTSKQSPVPLRPIAPPPRYSRPMSRPIRPPSRPISGAFTSRSGKMPDPPHGIQTQRTRQSPPFNPQTRPMSRPISRISRPMSNQQARTVASQPLRRQSATNHNSRRNSRRRQPSNVTRNIARGAGRVSRNMRDRTDAISEWFVGVPLGTRIGLIIVVVLMIWMCGISGPALMLQALAATIILNNGDTSSLSQNSLVAALPFVETITPTPSPSITLTPTSPPNATRTGTPIPTFTFTTSPTPLPTDTSTPLPTDTPTKTPRPVKRVANSVHGPINTPVSAVVLPSPTPPPTPTPDVDYLLKKVRKLTPCENQGKHHIFVTVLDAGGNGLNGVPVKVAWGGNANDNVIVTTETKNNIPGKFDFAMFKGTYSIEVTAGSSQVASGVTPDFEVDQPCHENGNAVGNSLYHASFEVIFQRTW